MLISRGVNAEPSTAAADVLMRTIPSTGEEICALGLGTYNGLMAPDLSDQSLSPRQQVLKIFFDAGGRLVDTAPSYGNAEQVIGILSQKLDINHELFIATKVLERDEPSALRSYERSFEVLKRDKLELMQVHSLMEWDAHLKTLRDWKERGKWRYIGVTHYQDHAHEELERVIRRDKPDFLQTNYSIAEPKAAERLLPVAKDLGVAVLINRPFAAGELFNAVKSKSFPDFARGFATSWAQAFLKFVLANDAVTCAIPATKNPNHCRDNMGAAAGRLPDAKELRRLATVL
jgi:diketogulonate reductase-like aldo/keto reductase